MTHESSGAFVLTLFRLKEGATVADYRSFTLGRLRADMMAFPSVTGFVDCDVSGYVPAESVWDAAEIIEVTSAEEFRRDNESAYGVEVAERWSAWVANSAVFFLHDLAGA